MLSGNVALWQQGLQVSHCSALVAKGSEADYLRPVYERTFVRYGSLVDIRVAFLKSLSASIV